MTRSDLTKRAKEAALANGADIVGVLKVEDLPEHSESIAGILPTASSVIVVASRHSLTALRSDNNQAAQFDTIYTYRECERAAHRASRFLESEGFLSVAVPAFIPIDMKDPKKGMQGEICWRRAGVRAGLGSYGENGLLITKKFGAALRLSGLVTSADLEVDIPLDEDICDHCMRCIEACPAKALSGGGKINKKLCGDRIFAYGLRFFINVLQSLTETPKEAVGDLLKTHGVRELWQTFMTGNYYYCFSCQSQCPAAELPQTDSL